MNWSSIKNIVGASAPLLGTLLGGPAGGVVGGMISSALGVENSPNAIEGILKANPDSATKLKQLELDHKADLERMALDYGKTAISQVNATMRMEVQSDHWWTSSWRPFWGYSAAVAFFAQTGGVTWLLITGGDAALISALGALSVFWSVPLAVLGVTAYGRSTEKIARYTGQEPTSIFGAIAKRIAGKGDN